MGMTSPLLVTIMLEGNKGTKSFAQQRARQVDWSYKNSQKRIEHKEGRGDIADTERYTRRKEVNGTDRALSTVEKFQISSKQNRELRKQNPLFLQQLYWNLTIEIDSGHPNRQTLYISNKKIEIKKLKKEIFKWNPALSKDFQDPKVLMRFWTKFKNLVKQISASLNKRQKHK